jgi:hypothetical protein
MPYQTNEPVEFYLTEAAREKAFLVSEIANNLAPIMQQNGQAFDTLRELGNEFTKYVDYLMTTSKENMIAFNGFVEIYKRYLEERIPVDKELNYFFSEFAPRIEQLTSEFESLSKNYMDVLRSELS